jgi:sugar O-acyltransferase (sialic acid O-acetyltransferase NeuD family)
MTQSLIVIGAGGHGRVVADLARAAGYDVAGFLDADPALLNTVIDGYLVLGNDSHLAGLAPGMTMLANGIGSVGDATARRGVFERLSAAGFSFPALVHHRATVAGGVVLAPGAQVMAGAVLQPGVQVGVNAVVNTGAMIDHDCLLEAHCHVSPGAVLCGGVVVEAAAHVGAAACVIQNRRIGAGALVAAGAVVTADVPAAIRVAGVPARRMD